VENPETFRLLNVEVPVVLTPAMPLERLVNPDPSPTKEVAVITPANIIPEELIVTAVPTLILSPIPSSVIELVPMVRIPVILVFPVTISCVVPPPTIVLPKVETPETTNVEAVASPRVDIPALTNPAVVVCPKVEIPVTAVLPETFNPTNAPTEVSEELTTPDPSVVDDRTLAVLILNVFVAAKSKCSDAVQESVAAIQFNVLLVAPSNVIPPPSAVTLVGVATEPNSIFLSSTVKVVELIVVVVPSTVKLPEIVTSLWNVAIPETLKSVADAPPENVENPETTNVDPVALPKVETPALERPVIFVCPSVVIPVTLNRAKSAP